MAEDKMTLMETYDLLEGLVHVNIEAGNGTIRYVVDEERPSDEERGLIDSIVSQYRKDNLKSFPNDFDNYSSRSEIFRKLDSF